jgi:hypothetical protein
VTINELHDVLPITDKIKANTNEDVVQSIRMIRNEVFDSLKKLDKLLDEINGETK